MPPALRLLAYVVLTAALTWWAFAATWPDDCAIGGSCGLASANAVFAGGVVLVVCVSVFGTGEAIGRRVRRRRAPADSVG